MKTRLFLAVIMTCTCVEWTRLHGRVKIINRRDSTVTIQNSDGDMLTIPIDYQVQVMSKHDELRGLKDLQLDDKITLTRIVSDKPKEDTEGLQQPEPTQRGH